MTGVEHDAILLVDTFVAGLPRTKGSLARRANGSLTESVVDSGRWRALMAGAVRDSYRLLWVRRVCTSERGPDGWPIGCGHPPHLPCGRPQPHMGGVEIEAFFQLPGDPLAARAGDLDKLLRNLLDAIASDSRNPRYNGGVIVNDNQVTNIVARKRGPLEQPGVGVRIWTSNGCQPS